MTSLDYVHALFIGVLVEGVEVAPDRPRKEGHVLADDSLTSNCIVSMRMRIARVLFENGETYDAISEVI